LRKASIPRLTGRWSRMRSRRNQTAERNAEPRELALFGLGCPAPRCL
jgi:hypothetical protein